MSLQARVTGYISIRLQSLGRICLYWSCIAEQLSISPRTVEVHRARIMQKLDLRSHTDLVLYALLRGILPLED